MPTFFPKQWAAVIAHSLFKREPVHFAYCTGWIFTTTRKPNRADGLISKASINRWWSDWSFSGTSTSSSSWEASWNNLKWNEVLEIGLDFRKIIQFLFLVQDFDHNENLTFRIFFSFWSENNTVAKFTNNYTQKHNWDDCGSVPSNFIQEWHH